MNIDLLLYGAAQLVTCGGPAGTRRGAAMADPGLIPNGAVAIANGTIVAVGDSDVLLARVDAKTMVDVDGRVLCPGFVDPHTHVVYAGSRLDEFELRLRGVTYMEIMAAGGGITRTMGASRAASVERLVAETRPRLSALLHHGATTVEVKTGYGLMLEAELRMLEAIADLDRHHPVDLVPTFMPAHALPPEFQGDGDAYVDLVIDEMLPAAARWYAGSHFAAQGTPFFGDVFCEVNAFTPAQSRRILQAGGALGLRPKIHADEFSALGGVELAIALEATSVDHLDVTAPAAFPALAASNVVAVLLPAVTFNLGSTDFAAARGLIDAGVAVALSTDINPGSSPCPSPQLVMAIACRYQRLLPAEALVACTINAAHAVGLGDVTGSLEVGKWADVLVVDADDYRELAHQLGGNSVQRVYKRGRLVWERA